MQKLTFCQGGLAPLLPVAVFCFPFLITALLLAGCSDALSPEDPIFDKRLSLKKRVKEALSKNYLEELGVDATTARTITVFYRQRGYRPVWGSKKGLDKRGKQMEKLLGQPRLIGLPNRRWKALKTTEKALVARELLLTTRLALAAFDLKHGWLDPETGMKPFQTVKAFQLKLLLIKARGVMNWGDWFAVQGPAHPGYRKLAKALYRRWSGRVISSKTFVVPVLKKDTIACLNAARASLYEKGYLADTTAADSIFLTSLMTFQVENGLKPDGILGTYTRHALEESDERKLDRTLLSLERWRWQKPLPDTHVWINIPEYMLRISYDGRVLSEHRIIVGKYETPTPQLESVISRIVSYPYWTQPYSIASKETLPELQRDPGYALENHYRIYRNGVEVDPYSVNWHYYKEKNFPFKVKQDPGLDNSLGVIKFEFNNPFGVYVHDTPGKSLFKRDIRSFSHGCMRCEFPDSLAMLILRRDEQRYTPDSLAALQARKAHKIIHLRHPILIRVNYVTVTTDSTGRIITWPDIYFRDKKLLSLVEEFL